ncbi:metallophosphoesterase [Buttiauxella massiliensis]|uniref:metallophosphoesterase n=1 Tax=Buttiauxella massiliensis TaxID=2831590 RepID=UPI00125EA462|nr:metallophosphoesterase [Buttiauxella massiliensis]
MSVYQHINGADWRNIWVTGDLHGCHSLLLKKLTSIGFDISQDLLISVGDMADRGAENVECLALLTRPWFLSVLGNHEQMLLDCLLNGGSTKHWRVNGGGWFFELDLEDEQRVRALLPQIAALPLVIEVTIQSKRFVICHADYPDNHYIFGKPVNEEAILWSRDRIAASSHGQVKAINGADQFIFGHTPLQTPQQFANQYYIDTGAVFVDNLTLLQIQGGESQL